MQFTACQHRFQKIAGIHGTFRFACADDGMQFIDEKDTLKRNLAVVINKVDIPTLEEKIGETAAQQYLTDNADTCKNYMDARDAVCRRFLEEYGAGNFVRTAEAKFKTGRYFTCSALGHNHEGQPYEGKNVVDPIMWLLQQADFSIKGSLSGQCVMLPKRILHQKKARLACFFQRSVPVGTRSDASHREVAAQ